MAVKDKKSGLILIACFVVLSVHMFIMHIFQPLVVYHDSIVTCHALKHNLEHDKFQEGSIKVWQQSARPLLGPKVIAQQQPPNGKMQSSV